MKKNRIKKPFVLLAVVFAASVLLSMFPASALADGDYSTIRVKLSTGDKAAGTSYATAINITLSGTYTLQENPAVVIGDKKYTVKLTGGQVSLLDGANVLFTGPTFKLISNTSAGQMNTISLYNIKYNSTRSYLGDMLFKPFEKMAGGKLIQYIQAINYVNVEEYLYGVVPHEMNNDWPLEALKAQAVCARGYAIAQIKTNQPNYEVDDTSGNQVYKGYDPANDRAIAAVKATGRQVVTYGGEMITTYFSASNGGYTEAAPNIWTPSQPKPYEVVKEDPYDFRNPSSPTETVFLPRDVAAYKAAHGAEENNKTVRSLNLIFSNYIAPQIQDNGNPDDDVFKAITAITGIVPDRHKKYPTCICNHVEKIQITAVVGINQNTTAPEDREFTATVNLSKFEDWGICNTTLSAYWLNESVQESFTGFNLRHARYGHGVGLSQRGAQQMANEGLGYAQILGFYYPNTSLEKTASIRMPVYVTPKITKIGKVANTSSLKIRSAPKTTAGSIGSALKKGKLVSIVKLYSKDWYQVWYGGILGYVQKKYISLQTGTKYYVKKNNTPVYKKNAMSSAVLAKLPKAKKITVYGFSGKYAYTLYGGQTGYVLKTVLSKKPVKPMVAAIGKVKVSQTVVRSGPDTARSKVATLKKGAKVEIIKLNYKATWHQIWYKGKAAYIKTSAVKLQ